VGTLVQAGVRVASFTAKKEGLEDLFLRVQGDGQAHPDARRNLLQSLGATPAPAPPSVRVRKVEP
jgi:hypothetical protein